MEPYRNRLPFYRNRLFEPLKTYVFLVFGRLMESDQVTLMFLESWAGGPLLLAVRLPLVSSF